MSILIGVKQADFNYFLEKTGATRGNLSVQLTKLKEAGYIQVEKSFKDNYPHTVCKITVKGRQAFEAYVDAIKLYLNIDDNLDG